MATPALNGNPLRRKGELQGIGMMAPDFLLTRNDFAL